MPARLKARMAVLGGALCLALAAPLAAQETESPVIKPGLSPTRDLRLTPRDPDQPERDDRKVPSDSTEPAPGGFVPQGGATGQQPGLSRPGSVSPSSLPPPPPALQSVTADPDDIVPGEILTVSASIAEATALDQALAPRGLTPLRRQPLGFLGGIVVTAYRLPAGRDVAGVLAELRQDFPQLWAGPNSLFDPSGSQAAQPRLYARDVLGWASSAAACGKGLRIGVIDTAVDLRHPALSGQAIVIRSFLPAGVPPARLDHGTAVAVLLAGNTQADGFAGLLPGAGLTIAEIFHAAGKGRARATTERVALALDWLGAQGARLVNLSLAGPRDPVLELVVGQAAQAGMTLVAAAGNAGPDAPPRFPAAHEAVIAVTAVDAGLKAYKKANRGDYIDFAAPGVDLWSASAGGGGRYHSGTSFAVPFVTAALAVGRISSPGLSSEQLVSQLHRGARDLGPAGKDPVYGSGLIQPAACTS